MAFTGFGQGRDRLLRRPGGQQLARVVAGQQAPLRRRGAPPAGAAARGPGGRVRRGQGVPPEPRHPVLEGQGAVQDERRRGDPPRRRRLRVPLAVGRGPARRRRRLPPRPRPARSATARPSTTTAPARSSRRSPADLRAAKADVTVAQTSSRPPRGATPPTTRASTCSGRTASSASGPTRPGAWLHSAKARDRVADGWRALDPAERLAGPPRRPVDDDPLSAAMSDLRPGTPGPPAFDDLVTAAEVAAVLGAPPDAVALLAHNPSNAVTGGIWRGARRRPSGGGQGPDRRHRPRGPGLVAGLRRRPALELVAARAARVPQRPRPPLPPRRHRRPGAAPARRATRRHGRAVARGRGGTDRRRADRRRRRRRGRPAGPRPRSAGRRRWLGRALAVARLPRDVQRVEAVRRRAARRTTPPGLTRGSLATSAPHRAGIARLHEQRDRLLALSLACPRTLCHLDLWPANIIRPADDPIVLVDWSFCGDGALGEDLGNLIPDSVFDLFLPVRGARRPGHPRRGGLPRRRGGQRLDRRRALGPARHPVVGREVPLARPPAPRPCPTSRRSPTAAAEVPRRRPLRRPRRRPRPPRPLGPRSPRPGRRAGPLTTSVHENARMASEIVHRRWRATSGRGRGWLGGCRCRTGGGPGRGW